MVERFAIACVVACLLACAFVVLQLAGERRSRGLLTSVALLLLGSLVVATRSEGIDIDWLRQQGLRSDALAMGLLVPLVTSVGGVGVAQKTRAGWAQAACIAAGLVAVGGGFAAVAIGRSGWYWEFVAIIVAGVALAFIGVRGATDRSVSANRRLVLGTAGAFGVAVAVGGSVLLLAWQALAT